MAGPQVAERVGDVLTAMASATSIDHVHSTGV